MSVLCLLIFFILSFSFCFFFFKQKTAYEMRISDWSSDVCSSDLGLAFACRRTGAASPAGGGRRRRLSWLRLPRPQARRQPVPGRPSAGARRGRLARAQVPRRQRARVRLPALCFCRSGGSRRSEEHTSELQSLMRISYAVFCLKKKN